jgi:hypothetical protein
MTGIPQFNIPAFDASATALRAQGAEIISPAELDDPEVRAEALASLDGVPNARTSGGHTWGDFLSRDVKVISDQVGGVLLMPNWHKSKGARLEAFVGLTTGKRFAWLEAGLDGTYAMREAATATVRAYLTDAMKELYV